MNISMFSSRVVPPAHYGGTERVVDWLIKALAFEGHKIYFFGPYGSNVPFAEKVFLLKFPDSGHYENIIDFRDMIPGDTDIIHIHGPSSLEYSYPVLKTIHGNPNIISGRKVSANYEHCSFVSNTHRNYCGMPENPYVYNGIDLSEYIYSEDKDEYLLFLGKVDWGVKGLSYAIKIAMDLKLKLLIAGDFLIPSNYNKIKSELTNDYIKYVGPVRGGEKAELLAGARALLFPVRWQEPFGITVIEALASGTPVLTSHLGAMPEIMLQGVTGFMCGTIGEMKESIKWLDRIDPKTCRKHVEDHFTSQRMAQDYLKLYEQVIHKYHSRKN
jgi:glycosyltransferase involved in cell wall biosynthesis